MNSVSGKFYSGTSGLVLPIPQPLYPAEFQGKSRLSYYASLFNSIEINSSFYKTPRVSTVIKWTESVPDHFRFTVKMSKVISHAKGLHFDPVYLSEFMKTIDQIGNRKGCLLIQFPPSLKVEKRDQLQHLLLGIMEANTNGEWKIAVEFRNNSWYCKEVYDLLNQYNACLVLHDLPASATPLELSTGDFKYLRFHGPDGSYRGSYTDELLNAYANHINKWRNDGKEVYFYFNNTMGDALKNLQTLINFLQ